MTLNRFGNMKIVKKLALATGASVFQLACLAGLSLWALSDMNSAAIKAEHYAYKLDLAESIDARESEIALRMSSLPTSRQVSRDVEQVLVLRKEYRAALDELKETATTDEDKTLLRHIEEIVAPWRDLNNQIMQAVQAGKHMDAAQVREESVARFDALKPAVAAYLKYRQGRLETFQKEQQDTGVPRLRLWLIGFAICSLLTASILNMLTARSIAVPLEKTVALLESVANGDLTEEVAAEYLARKDEVGMLTRAVETMTASLRDVFTNITDGIHMVSSSSTELSANSGQMTDGARVASDKAHSVATATEEMTATIMSVATGMEQTTTNVAVISSATEEMTATIGEIAGNSEKARRITEEANRQAARISEQMNQLGQAAHEIGKVTETITEISSQTNLLALNATIEAARAGSAGKGFAVVANEIKELAQQTAAATEDIKARIAGVQSSSAGGIAEIDKVSRVIHEVSEIVASIAAAIEEQSTMTKDIAGNIGEAATGVKDANLRVVESSQATQEIAREIAGVDHAASQMADGSEQVKVGAAGLTQVAEQLQAAVARFRVSNGDSDVRGRAVSAHSSSVDLAMLQTAISAHSAWRARLKTASASGKFDFPVSTVKADNQCQFGKWLYGSELPADEKQTEQYRKVKRLHAQFHEEASKVAQFAISGQQSAAEKALGLSGDFSKTSSALMDALHQWGGTH